MFIDEDHQHDANRSFDPAFPSLGHLPYESISQMGPSTPMKEWGADINTASFSAIQYVGWTNTFPSDDTAIASASPRRF